MNLAIHGVIVTDGRGQVSSENLAASASAASCGDRPSRMTPIVTMEWQNRVAWVVKHELEDGHFYGLWNPDANRAIELRGQR